VRRLTGPMLGNPHDARRAVLGWEPGCHCGCEEHDRALSYEGVPDYDHRRTMRLIGVGESREAWLVNGIVYKVGRDRTNVYEHEALAEWREEGAQWAPVTYLHEVTDQYGFPRVVLAMPYLPEDGEVDPATLAEIRQAAPQAAPENYRSSGGQTWLIDGVDIEVSPPSRRCVAGWTAR
jgi:hypothetical protein